MPTLYDLAMPHVQTGILGLPVTLVNSGFEPFFVVLTITLFMQLATIYLQVDNMQLAQKLLVAQRDSSRGDDSLPQPDLHSMGRLFLPRGLALAFDASVVCGAVCGESPATAHSAPSV